MGESGEDWDFHQVGTTAEKSSVAKELTELRERLSMVDEWKRRREEIDDELNKVWVDGGDELAPPSYVEVEKQNAEKLDTETAAEPATEAESEASMLLEDSQTSLLSQETTGST
jgi:ATP-binding cassette subfamily D (ALD) long-chain fatty acid import protein